MMLQSAFVLRTTARQPPLSCDLRLVKPSGLPSRSSQSVGWWGLVDTFRTRPELKIVIQNLSTARFTDHTADLTISSQLYKAATGFSPTSIETKDKFSVDNLDVAGILDAASITEVDIMAGKYDFAEIEIFMVNVTDLTQGVITHRRGWLGELSLKNGQFVAEVRGLTQKLILLIPQLYSCGISSITRFHAASCAKPSFSHIHVKSTGKAMALSRSKRRWFTIV